MQNWPCIEWFELYDNTWVHIEDSFHTALKEKVKTIYTKRSFDKRIGISGAYYTKTRMRAGLLKSVLVAVGTEIKGASDKITHLGRNKTLPVAGLPFRISPIWAELLAHAFFDGYADEHSMRYSNYDPEIRKEIGSMSEKIGIMGVNVPVNHKNDIGLPEVVPKMLMSIFHTYCFGSKTCRIPKILFGLASRNDLFGWYFIKGAFLDEGTLTSGQIWIVRG